MLLLKPLSEDRGRSLVPMSQLLLSLRLQGYASQTCTHVRLLGPCFKTGRNPPLPDSSPKRYLTARPCIIILHDPEASRRNWGVSLHSERFHVLFTFFSKFFSSFPHGTCSLSVSREYLGLDGIYHPFCAAVPSNTTLSLFGIEVQPCLTGLLPSTARHLLS